MSRIRAAHWLIVFTAGVLAATCAPQTFSTPLEEAEVDRLTSHTEMLAFLEHLQEGTEAFTLERIGTSVEGRGLVLLHFRGPETRDPSSADKLKILIFAQQHGDEPSGKEAAIALARDIAAGTFADFLEAVDLYLIPQVNPDGSEALRRENGERMDLNRDHLTLDTPEVRSVHQVFQGVMPEVVLDVHEYGITGRAWVEKGIRKDFGQQIGALSNANMSHRLRSFAWNQVIPEMTDALAERDVSLNRYLVSDGPDARFRYSTTALNDGRNSTGIYNALTFLIEGRNGLTVEENIRERTRQQLETMKAFLTFFSQNAQETAELVHAEQAVLAGDDPPPDVALVMDYVPDPARPAVTVGVVDIESGEKSRMVIENFCPLVEATLSVHRPRGYAIPPDLTEVIEVLERHAIPMTSLDAPLTTEVETDRITGVTSEEKEDKDFLAVNISSKREFRTIPTGYILVRTRGIQTNLIVSLLEPQSQWGLAPLPDFRAMLQVGREYPVLRILGELN